MSKINLKKVLDKAKETGKNVANSANKLIEDSKPLIDKAGKKVEDFAKDGSDFAVKAFDDAKEKMHEAKIEVDKNRLKPIFDVSEIKECGMVCISDKDQKRKNSEACNDSIGHYEEVKGLRVLNIYKNSLEKYNFDFYPNSDYGFYYISPVDSKKLIKLERYFDYVKSERVAELHDIAYDIGASYVAISYKEQEKTLVSKDYDFVEKIKKEKLVKADAKEKITRKEMSKTDFSIIDSAHYHDNSPKTPNLNYFIDDQKIGTLIKASMEGKTEDRHINIKYNTSMFMNKETAIKIDAALKQYGASGNGSMASEVEKESRTELDFYVEFPKK